MNKKFHERFDIEIGVDEARRRFVNRVHNHIFEGFIQSDFAWGDRNEIHRRIVSAIGERYDSSYPLLHYVGSDFQRCLRALEALAMTLGTHHRSQLDAYIGVLLAESEADLGIEWKDGIFLRKGASLLDKKLVNEPLGRLADPRYANVLAPFSKGLQHLLESEKRPELRSDVITDMYEALEALAKIVTERSTKELSANAELFIKTLSVSDGYRSILKEYIKYANDFRHALEEGRVRPTPPVAEVESFVYLTGLFIRLAIQ